MKLPRVKLSTLIVLQIAIAILLWLNLGEAITGMNSYIVPVGWPNDAVFIYQESYHELRAAGNLESSWGQLSRCLLAGNILICSTLLAAIIFIMEWKELNYSRPTRNTGWMLAATLSILLALNLWKRPGTFIDDFPELGSGYGFPFIFYSVERWLLQMLNNEPTPWSDSNGWHLPALFANVAASAWTLFAMYLICQKLFRAPAADSTKISVEVSPTRS